MMLTRRRFLASTAALLATTSLVPPAAAEWPLADQLAFAKACDDLADKLADSFFNSSAWMDDVLAIYAQDLRAATAAIARDLARAAVASRI